MIWGAWGVWRRRMARPAEVQGVPAKQLEVRLFQLPLSRACLRMPRCLKWPVGQILSCQHCFAQAYVRERILSFVVEPAFARRLYMAPDDVREAATEAMVELARPLDGGSSASYKLVFRHTCLCALVWPPGSLVLLSL